VQLRKTSCFDKTQQKVAPLQASINNIDAHQKDLDHPLWVYQSQKNLPIGFLSSNLNDSNRNQTIFAKVPLKYIKNRVIKIPKGVDLPKIYKRSNPEQDLRKSSESEVVGYLIPSDISWKSIKNVKDDPDKRLIEIEVRVDPLRQ
jgi:hypothetical protein